MDSVMVMKLVDGWPENFPLALRVIDIGTTDARKREVLKEYDGRAVFIMDDHIMGGTGYVSGTIDMSESDCDSYYLIKGPQKDRRKLHYDALFGLLEPVE
jgi:hypothetical protein